MFHNGIGNIIGKDIIRPAAQFRFESKSRSSASMQIDQGRAMLNRGEKSIMGMKLNEETITPIDRDPRWQRVVARDKSADGMFWYSVATTGVYCRPSCPSRTANPRNVKFHDVITDAQAAGFRACKRCNPDGLTTDAINAAIITKVCRLIEQGETAPSLTDLAEATELSPGYLHRLFKSATGVTPKAYAKAHRADRLRTALRQGASVTEAIYDAGFNSSGRFYEQAADILGMTPTRYKAGGIHEEIRFAIAECSLGSILVASSEKGVVSILLGDDPNALAKDLQDRFPKARLIGGNTGYDRLVAQVIHLVEVPGFGLNLPLDVRGTAFQQRVWQALREIPVGHTASYRDIAERIGAPTAVRAVAGACAANNIAVAIPCHRVVRTDGSLSGYAWSRAQERAAQARVHYVAAAILAEVTGLKPSIARMRWLPSNQMTAIQPCVCATIESCLIW